MRGEPVHSTLMTRQGEELILPICAQALVPSLIFCGVWERFQRNSGLLSPLPLVPTLIKEVCDA